MISVKVIVTMPAMQDAQGVSEPMEFESEWRGSLHWQDRFGRAREALKSASASADDWLARESHNDYVKAKSGQA